MFLKCLRDLKIFFFHRICELWKYFFRGFFLYHEFCIQGYQFSYNPVNRITGTYIDQIWRDKIRFRDNYQQSIKFPKLHQTEESFLKKTILFCRGLWFSDYTLHNYIEYILLLQLTFAAVGLSLVQRTAQPDLVVGLVDRICVEVDHVLCVDMLMQRFLT